MSSLEESLRALPEAFKDLRLNLTTLLRDASLPAEERFAVAVSAASFVGNPQLAAAIREQAGTELSEGAGDDAQAAAGLMAMTTVYYKSINMLAADEYRHMQPKLRLQRMFSVKSSKRLFELCAVACAAIAGCENCLGAHEENLRKEGVTHEQVHDTIRIAAVVNAVACASTIAAGVPAA